MKLKKNLQKINDLEQNSILNISRYQKRFQVDLTGTIENFTLEKRISYVKSSMQEKKYQFQLKERRKDLHLANNLFEYISYVNKENIFIITSKIKIEHKTFYWLKTEKIINISTKGFKDKNYLLF